MVCDTLDISIKNTIYIYIQYWQKISASIIQNN